MTDLVHVLAVQDSVGSGYFSLRPKKAGGGTYSCRPPRPSGSARRAEPSDDEVRRRARVVVVLHVSQHCRRMVPPRLFATGARPALGGASGAALALAPLRGHTPETEITTIRLNFVRGAGSSDIMKR